MFKTENYLTRGVRDIVPMTTQLIMWDMIFNLPVSKDYLQIFELRANDGMQFITHIQEQPDYRRTVIFKTLTAITQKVYVIDGDHCTMLLMENTITIENMPEHFFVKLFAADIRGSSLQHLWELWRQE